MTGSGHEIRLQRMLHATPEAVFNHWVDAAAQRRWYAPVDGWIIEAHTDLRVGGTCRVQFGPHPDEMYVEHGVFEEVDRPHRLVYTTRHEFPDGRAPFDTRVTVTCESHGEGTLLTVIDSGYPNEELRAQYEDGWPHFLDAFQRTLR